MFSFSLWCMHVNTFSWSTLFFFQWFISQQVSFYIFPMKQNAHHNGIDVFILNVWFCILSVVYNLLWIHYKDLFLSSQPFRTNPEDAVCRNILNQISLRSLSLKMLNLKLPVSSQSFIANRWVVYTFFTIAWENTSLAFHRKVIVKVMMSD